MNVCFFKVQVSVETSAKWKPYRSMIFSRTAVLIDNKVNTTVELQLVILATAADMSMKGT
jgi:hypothetical protein